MASVTINGTVKVVGKTQQISEKFSKRELVITEQSGNYPEHIPVEFTQDKTGMLDPYAPGDQVTVTAFISGREWTGKDGVTKHFLSLKGDRIEKVVRPHRRAPVELPPLPRPAWPICPRRTARTTCLSKRSEVLTAEGAENAEEDMFLRILGVPAPQWPVLHVLLPFHFGLMKSDTTAMMGA
ncbi:MAG: DUF3127 domain-containing protein [Flavobacteriales bacterium]|nr:DUF3127 domain-containing protein [Flavobacteriales bacterium]